METSLAARLDSPRAWLVDAAGFLACFVGFGVLYSFGIFLPPMRAEFGVSHAVMSTLFSFMSILSYVLGPFTGNLADRIGPRKVMLAGAGLMAAGLIATARMHSFLSAFACLGIGVGAGLACVFVPSMAAVGEWFQRNRDLALGIAISGIGCGTLAAAPIGAALIRDYGWRNTLTIFGIAGGALLLLSALWMAAPPTNATSRGSGQGVWKKVRTARFSVMYVALFLSATAILIAMVYLPALAEHEGMTRVAAASLVGYIGGASVVSRLGLDAVAGKLGILRVYQFSFFIVCAACFVWMYVTSHMGLVLFSIILGVGYGGVAALTPAVAIDMFGLEGLGELLGILLTAFGSASVAGPPLAGYLVDRSGNYRDIIWYALLTSVLSVIMVLVLRGYSPADALDQREEAAA